MKKVAVVTVNFNTDENTKTFLRSLEKVKHPEIDLQTIVVDNGSEKVLHLEEKKNLVLIRLEENTGFTGGFNTGMKYALENGAEYILVINNDTEMDPDLLVELLRVLDSNEHIALTVPKIYFAKGHEYHKHKYKQEELGKVFWYAGGSMDWDNALSVHRGVDEVDHGQYDAIEKIDFATGCCMMLKASVLKKVGFFDERYFLYFEDADLNERIKREGFTVYYVPTAVLYHTNASSSGGAGRGNLLQDYFLTRNQMLFGMLYAPLRTKAALVRQSLRLHFSGRPEQKKAIRDFYTGKFGKGTFFDKK